jgi:hypothetical protein
MLDFTAFDPLLIFSIILMQIGAKYLDIQLTEFQRSFLKNHFVQAIILCGIVYIPVRDIFKTIIIVCLIYLIVYVLLNEKHKYNIYSKRWLYTNGFIDEYNNIKDNYYKNLVKLKNDYYI